MMPVTDRPHLRTRIMLFLSSSSRSGPYLYHGVLCLLIICSLGETEGLMCGIPGRSDNETLVSLYSAAAYSTSQKAEYSCQKGYTLLGDAVRTCLEDGSWSGLRPRCVPNVAYKRPVASSRIVNHHRPDLIVDGDSETCIYLDMRVEDRFIQIDLGRNYQIRGLVLHVPDGYVQELSIFVAEKLESGTGIQYRRCTPSLSRVSAPKLQVDCRNEVGTPTAVTGRFLHIRDERKAHDFYFALCEIEIYTQPETLPGCGIPDQPAFAAPIEETLLFDRQPNLNTFDIRCQPGFRRIPDDGLLRCVQGQWIGPVDVFQCEAVECNPLAPLIHGQIELFPVRGLSNHSFDTVARHRCSDGFMIFGGDVTRTCGHDGRWTGNPPICRPVDCGLPRPVSNAAYNLVDGHTKPGAITQYNCFDGYVPQRILADKPLQTSIVCQRSGAWKEGNFYCAKRTTYYYPSISVSPSASTDKPREFLEEEQDQKTELYTTLNPNQGLPNTSPRILEIDFVQPTVNLPEDFNASIKNGIAETHYESTSNGTAMVATGFVVAFVFILMITIGIALNICRMRAIFFEVRKRVLSTAIIHHVITATETFTKKRMNIKRSESSKINTCKPAVVKTGNEPVYNELDDQLGLGVLFPPPLFSSAPLSSVTSEDEGTYLDIDLSKNTDMDVDSLQSLSFINKTDTHNTYPNTESNQQVCPKKQLTPEELLLLYAKIDKSKKTKNRIQNLNALSFTSEEVSEESKDQSDFTLSTLSTDCSKPGRSPVISKDRSLPRRKDYHPRKVNDHQWSTKVVEVSLNEPQLENKNDLYSVKMVSEGRPLPPLPNTKDFVVVAGETTKGITILTVDPRA